MQTKSSAATTARPTTPNLRDAEKAALAHWAALSSTSTTTEKAMIIGKVQAKVSPNKLAPPAPQRATRPTRPARLTAAALEAALPITKTRYARVEITSTTLYNGSVLKHKAVTTLVRDDEGSVISRHPELTPWTTFTPALRVYKIDRYIDEAGVAALSRKMGAKVVFANDALTTLAALNPEQRAERRDARRAEAERLSAERAARAATYARLEAERLERLEAERTARRDARAALKAERTTIVLALASELTVTAAAARRALADAEWNKEDARNALALAAMKAKEAKKAKAERKEAAKAQPLSAAARRLLATLRALGGMAPYAQRALARAQGGVGMAATVKALAKVAKTWGRYTTFDEYDLEALEGDFQNAYAATLPACERAAVRAARPLNKDKGTPQALTLALTLARKVRG